MLPIHFAPIQGYTDDVYRRIHNRITGGISSYYTPFIRVEAGSIRSKDMRDINPKNNMGVTVIPQIIFSNRKEFDYLVDRISEIGYRRIDLNMGCPFPMQAKHGRGSGILQNPNIIKEVLEALKEHADIRFSVKIRLGWEHNYEALNIVDYLNDVDFEHITVHPRTGIQQYKGSVDIDMFEEIYTRSRNPIIYNGDINNIEKIREIEKRFPDIAGVMIGRGLLGCPSLATEYAQGKEWCRAERIGLLLRMHEIIKEEYSRILVGDVQLHNKLRTFWEYSEELISRKAYKKIMKSGNLKNYTAAVSELQRSL